MEMPLEFNFCSFCQIREKFVRKKSEIFRFWVRFLSKMSFLGSGKPRRSKMSLLGILDLEGLKMVIFGHFWGHFEGSRRVPKAFLEVLERI